MELRNLHIIDPHKLTDEDCPIFVQAADIKGFFGWGIRWRTKSSWNHSMVLYKQGLLATQGWTYKAVPIDTYLTQGQLLKFWRCKDITEEERHAILIKINYRLSKPKYKTFYDIPGVIGQFFGMRWFNVPWLNYCSEDVIALVQVIINISLKHPTPEDIDTLFKESPRMEVIGYSMNV